LRILSKGCYNNYMEVLKMVDEQAVGKVKVSIYMERDFHETIKLLAADDHRSVNSLVLKLLQDYVRAQGDK